MNKNLRVALLDIKYNLKAYCTYRFAFFSDLGIFTILFGGILFARFGSLNASAYIREGVNEGGLFLMGYLLWQYASAAISSAGNMVRNECMAGTIQHKLMSDVPLSVLFFSNYISMIVTQTMVVLALCLFARFAIGIQMVFSVFNILVMLIALVGMFAIGMMVGGAALKVKRTGSLVNIIQILLLLGGNVMSRSSLHPILQGIPLYKGIQLMQEYALTAFVDTQGLLVLIGSSVFLLLVGNGVMKHSLARMKEDYSIYHY